MFKRLVRLLVAVSMVVSAASLTTWDGAAASSTASAVATITVAPPVVFPPNKLCDQVLGTRAFPHVVKVRGKGFPPGGPTTITESGTPVASVVDTPTGTFSARFKALAAPAGSYPVVATSGPTSAAGTVNSSVYSCWSESGFVGQPLEWRWEGAGYDVATTAVFRVGGVKLEGALTDLAGHWRKKWTAPCPTSGTLQVTITATSGGVRRNMSAGSVNC